MLFLATCPTCFNSSFTSSFFLKKTFYLSFFPSLQYAVQEKRNHSKQMSPSAAIASFQEPGTEPFLREDSFANSSTQPARLL